MPIVSLLEQMKLSFCILDHYFIKVILLKQFLLTHVFYL